MNKSWLKSKTIWFGIIILAICAYSIYRNPSTEAMAVFLAGIGVIYSRYTARTKLK
jgi:hypothetical protein